jgi:hypothetical protein
MKNLIIGLLIGLTAFPIAPALGALSESDRAVLNGRNTLTNPGAEASTAGFAASGGTFTTTTTAANIGNGNATFSWDSSAASQTVISGYQTITSGDGYSKQNGVVSARFKCASGTCTHKLQVYDGTTVLNEVSITSSTTGFVRATVNFIYPDSGTIAWRLISVAANEPIIYFDDLYRGLADGFNLSQVSQARVYGTLTYAAATNCSWLANATTYADAAADTDCSTPVATGSVTAPATKVMQGVLNNAPPGIFDVSVQFRVDQSVSAVGACRIVDDLGNQFGQDEFITGTAVAIPLSLSGTYTYTTGGNRTLKVQCKASSGSVNLVAITGDFIMTVRYSPSSTQQVYGPDATAASWTGYFTGCNWSSTGITAFADTTTSACTLNTRLNTNLGTVTQESGNHSGITFTPTKAGKVKTCVRGVAYNSTVSGAQGIRLTDGTNVADTTQLNLLTTTQPFSLSDDGQDPDLQHGGKH